MPTECIVLVRFAREGVWRGRVCGRCAARPRRRRGRAAMAQIWGRICWPSAARALKACAARPTRSRLPAALEHATGPRERSLWCAAAAEMEDFHGLFLPSRVVANRIARTAEACGAAVAGSNRYSPASAACGTQSWLRLRRVSLGSLEVNLAWQARGFFRRS